MSDVLDKISTAVIEGDDKPIVPQLLASNAAEKTIRKSRPNRFFITNPYRGKRSKVFVLCSWTIDYVLRMINKIFHAWQVKQLKNRFYTSGPVRRSCARRLGPCR